MVIAMARMSGQRINKDYDFGKRFNQADVRDLKEQGYSRKDIKKFAKRNVDRDQMMGTTQKRLGIHGGGKKDAPASAADYDPSQIGMSRIGGEAAQKFNMNDVNYLRKRGGGFSDREIAKAIRASDAEVVGKAAEFERDTLGVDKDNKFGKVFGKANLNQLRAEGYKDKQIKKYIRKHVGKDQLGGRAQLDLNMYMPEEGPETLADYDPNTIGAMKDKWGRADIRYLKDQGFKRKDIAQHMQDTDAIAGRGAQKFMNKWITKIAGDQNNAGRDNNIVEGDQNNAGRDNNIVGGDQVDVGGDYTKGDKTDVGGDYTLGDKTDVGGDYTLGDKAGRDNIGGDKVGRDDIGGDRVDMDAKQRQNMDVDITDESQVGFFDNEISDDRDFTQTTTESYNTDYTGGLNLFGANAAGGRQLVYQPLINYGAGSENNNAATASKYIEQIQGQNFLQDGWMQALSTAATAIAQKNNPMDLRATQDNIQARADNTKKEADYNSLLSHGNPLKASHEYVWNNDKKLSGMDLSQYNSQLG
tara:strand:+ start:2984 stop:4567 length:1584 start_codon:yes stop_codon:yes gene_type:complete